VSTTTRKTQSLT